LSTCGGEVIVVIKMFSGMIAIQDVGRRRDEFPA